MSDQREGGIAWTDQTWNPVRGCSRVDPDCVNCYAEGVAARFSGPGQPYEGLAFRKLKVLQDGTERTEARWTGEVRMVPEHLADPLRWKRPRKVFVNSMSDLFHEKLSNEQIAAVFGVMAAAPRHTFQVLTKRARRMREWFEWLDSARPKWLTGPTDCDWRVHFLAQAAFEATGFDGEIGPLPGRWPLPNVWIGTSVGHQGAAHRIEDLRACPAAVLFVSFEPLHGPVSSDLTGIHWGIIGGESGTRARSFDLGWGREVAQSLRAVGASVFWKQLGARPFDEGRELRLIDGHGADPAEWPEDLVREWPGSRT